MSSSEKFVQPAIPRFDGYYDFWSMTMENFLRSRELWRLVEEGIPAIVVGTTPVSEAQRSAVEEAKLKDLKVKNFLFQAIDREILETILDKSTSKAIWESMKKKYQGSTKVKRAQLQALRKEFELLAMKEGEKIDTFLGRTLTVVNKMKTNGEVMEQSTIVSKILRSLTPKFNYVVCSIEESNDLSTLSIDELHGSLLVHEQRLNGHVQEEQALKVTHEERPSQGRGRGVFRGSRGRGRGRGRSGTNRAIVECYKCHNLGHFQYECPEWEKNANYAELEEEEELLLMAYVEQNQANRDEVWFLDSGCSNHMTGSKEWFSELEEGFNRTVKLGNDTRMSVVGKGSVKVKVNGVTQVIPEVYYVPELRNNLLSLGQLQERGLAILIRDGTCKVYHPSKGAIMETNMSGNRMFFLLASKPQKNSLCLQTEEVMDKENHLWHCRFGHLNQEGLKLLAHKKMVIGLPILKATKEICAICLTGKQHRESMSKKTSWKSSTQLQLVHSDICGPITPISHSGKRYILSFIDDFTRKTWVYFLHEKSEAFATFKIFKASVEKEIGAFLTCLRTDRGGEFTSNEFGEFCRSHGISRQLTAAFTPQQNGVAERKNRTIMNAVRSMLSERQVPKMFWSEATKWSVHIQNRSPTAAVEGMTPEEAWSGRKPVVEYFRVFGCIGYVHIPDQKRSKLDDKSKKCVFLGVSEESKAWRLYDPVMKKIVISKDVVFDEDKSWDWDQADVEAKEVTLECGDEDDEKNSEVAKPIAVASPNHVGSDNNVSSSPILAPSSPAPSPVAAKVTRERRPPGWMADYETGEGEEIEENLSVMLLMMMTEADPIQFDDAVKDKIWREAMEHEIESIVKNNTWELTTLPKGFTPIGVKWVYKTKLNEDGEVDKYKARLVAKGYAQCYGIDYTEVFAPVARLDTVRTILAISSQFNWEIFQLDVKSAFLHGELKEEVYVRQPEGFIREGEEEKVYKLRKALYGLKQAPRAWYSRIEAYFLKEEFERCPSEHTLFTKTRVGNILIVSLYVDDLIFTGSDKAMCDEFKKSMMLEFEMSDLGKMKHFLGIEVKQSDGGIFICQRRYAREVLARFGMDESNAVKNPIVPGTKLTKDENGEKVDETMFKQLVGSLMYLTVTRPDLMYGVCLISRFMSNPRMSHWLAAKRILRYLKGTVELGIFYRRRKNRSLKLMAFTDSDYAGDLNDRRSTSGFVFLMASGAICWASKKQPVVALSTTEAEYIAAAFCACQCVWLRKVLEKLGAEEKSATVINCDNSSTIQLSKHPVLHGKSKHIEVRFHYLRDLVNGDVVKLEYCPTEDQVADIFTKPLKLEQFEKLRALLGMVNMSEVS